jgi:hypothetical protein
MSDGVCSVRGYPGTWTEPRLRNELPEYVQERWWLEAARVAPSKYLGERGTLFFTQGTRSFGGLLMPPTIICADADRDVAELLLRELRRIWIPPIDMGVAP